MSIIIEDLNIKGMMKNRHLSKEIAQQKFFEFRTKLNAKCNELCTVGYTGIYACVLYKNLLVVSKFISMKIYRLKQEISQCVYFCPYFE